MTQREIIQKQIDGYASSVEYLDGADRTRIENLIDTLKMSLEYLPETAGPDFTKPADLFELGFRTPEDSDRYLYPADLDFTTAVENDLVIGYSETVEDDERTDRNIKNIVKRMSEHGLPPGFGSFEEVEDFIKAELVKYADKVSANALKSSDLTKSELHALQLAAKGRRFNADRTEKRAAKAAAKKDWNSTPLMKQYNSFKEKYPDALLLFRVGDFYETFGEDARHAADVLGIILTKNEGGMDLAGFPHQNLDRYLPKLVRAGYHVAVADELEDPKTARGLVKRGVTELLGDKKLNFKDLLRELLDEYLTVVNGAYCQAESNLELISKVEAALNVSDIRRDLLRELLDEYLTVVNGAYCQAESNITLIAKVEAALADELEVTPVKKVEKSPENKPMEEKKSIFGAAKTVKPAAKKKDEKTEVEVPGIEEKLLSMEDLKAQIADLQAQLVGVHDEVKNLSIGKFQELYKQDQKNPKSFIIKDGKGCVMVVPMDKYISIKDESRVADLRAKYGEGIVTKDEKYFFNPSVLERNQKIIEELIGNSEKISDEDKANMLVHDVQYSIAKGTIDQLMKLGHPMPTIIADVQPIFALKSCGERAEGGLMFSGGEVIDAPPIKTGYSSCCLQPLYNFSEYCPACGAHCTALSEEEAFSELAEHAKPVEFARGGRFEANVEALYSELEKGDRPDLNKEERENILKGIVQEFNQNFRHDEFDPAWVVEEYLSGNMGGGVEPSEFARGGQADNLVKELRRLHRDLNSHRLLTYMEGDKSEKEMARQRERASKLARFNEVRQLLRERDDQFARGGRTEKLYDTDAKREAFVRKRGNIITFKEKWPTGQGDDVNQIITARLHINRGGFSKGAAKIIGNGRYDSPWFKNLKDLLDAIDWDKMEQWHSHIREVKRHSPMFRGGRVYGGDLTIGGEEGNYYVENINDGSRAPESYATMPEAEQALENYLEDMAAADYERQEELRRLWDEEESVGMQRWKADGGKADGYDYDYKHFVLVTNFQGSGEDLMMFLKNVGAAEVEAGLKKKNVQYDECYEVPENDLGVTSYDEELYGDAKLEEGIIRSAEAQRATGGPAEPMDEVYDRIYNNLKRTYDEAPDEWHKNRAVQDVAYVFAGDHNKRRRQMFMRYLTGSDLPISKCGITAISEALKSKLDNKFFWGGRTSRVGSESGTKSFEVEVSGKVYTGEFHWEVVSDIAESDSTPALFEAKPVIDSLMRDNGDGTESEVPLSKLEKPLRASITEAIEQRYEMNFANGGSLAGKLAKGGFVYDDKAKREGWQDDDRIPAQFKLGEAYRLIKDGLNKSKDDAIKKLREYEDLYKSEKKKDANAKRFGKPLNYYITQYGDAIKFLEAAIPHKAITIFGEKCILNFYKYQNDTIAIEAVSVNDFEPYLFLTVNWEQNFQWNNFGLGKRKPLTQSEAYAKQFAFPAVVIKNYDENKGIVKVLEDAGVIQKGGAYLSGSGGTVEARLLTDEWAAECKRQLALQEKKKKEDGGPAEKAAGGAAADTQIQTILFERDSFNESEAKAWLKENKFLYGKVEKNKKTLRFRQKPPRMFKDFKTITLDVGIKAVIGKPKK